MKQRLDSRAEPNGTASMTGGIEVVSSNQNRNTMRTLARESKAVHLTGPEWPILVIPASTNGPPCSNLHLSTERGYRTEDVPPRRSEPPNGSHCDNCEGEKQGDETTNVPRPSAQMIIGVRHRDPKATRETTTQGYPKGCPPRSVSASLGISDNIRRLPP